MEIIVDSKKGRELAQKLHHAFSTSGIHGRTEMPEDITPAGIKKGSLEHLMFITLTVSIDYQRDAPALWESSRKTFQDPETTYLYNPQSLHEAPYDKVLKDLQRYKLSKKQSKDTEIWRTVGITFHKKWDGDPRNFLQDCKWDSIEILKRLNNDAHINNNKKIPDYPYLRGPKIGPLWLRMLRDNIGITELNNLDKVPIPVDIHVARATLSTGIVRGNEKCSVTQIFEHIRNAWFESVKDVNLQERPMIALDVDEPLWHLSKYGCSRRDGVTGNCPVPLVCEAREFCIPGKILINQDKGTVEINT